MSVPKAPHETSKTTCEGRSCRHRRHARGAASGASACVACLGGFARQGRASAARSPLPKHLAHPTSRLSPGTLLTPPCSVPFPKHLAHPGANAPRSPCLGHPTSPSTSLAPLAKHLAHPAIVQLPLPNAPRPLRLAHPPHRALCLPRLVQFPLPSTSRTQPRSPRLAEHLARSPRQAPRPPRNCSALLAIPLCPSRFAQPAPPSRSTHPHPPMINSRWSAGPRECDRAVG
jgi:hypothetical protein